MNLQGCADDEADALFTKQAWAEPPLDLYYCSTTGTSKH